MKVAILLTLFVSLSAFCEQMSEFEKATKNAAFGNTLKDFSDYELRITVDPAIRDYYKVGEVREYCEKLLKDAKVPFAEKSKFGLKLHISGDIENNVLSWKASMTLSERVFLKRARQPREVDAMTWQNEMQGSVHTRRAQETLKIVIEQTMNAFIESWQSSNAQ